MADVPPTTTVASPTAHLVSSTGTDRLDSLITTTKPRGWWALAAIAVSVVAIAIWSIVAVIPQQVRAMGVVTAVDLVKVVAAPADGRVEILVSPGDTVQSSEPVATLTPFDGSPEITLTAPTTGVLQSQLVQQGEGVLMGEEILKVREPVSTERGQIVVAYLSSANAVHFELGDEPQVIITDVANGQTQQTAATVVRIDNVPSSLLDMAIVLGSLTEAEEAAREAGGQPYGILMRLEGGGSEAELQVLQPGEVVEIVQTYAEVHPIELLFGGN